MTDEVKIPVKTTYDGAGFEALRRDAAKARREEIAATRAQISEHKNLMRLTAQLDKNLAGGGKKQSLAEQIGVQFVAANVLRDVIGGLKDFGVESLQAAAAADRLGQATNAMAMGFNSSGQAITQSIQQASQYTINQMAAMQAANQAMLLGVAKSPAEFDKLTRIAVGLGRAMGQDATKSIEDFTVGLGRQSKLILDNLGLMVSVEKANEKYAASVGKSVSQLTDAEKKQAFINEALAQGEAKLASLGDQTLGNAGKMERLTARWADFQVEFGRAVNSMSESTGALDLLNAGLDKLIQGAQGWQQAAQGAEMLSAGLDKMNKGTWLESLEKIPVIGQSIKGLDFWASQIVRADDYQKAMTQVGQEMAATEAAQRSAAVAAREQADAEGQASTAMEDSAKKAEELAQHLQKVTDARENVARKLIDIENTAAKETQATWDEYFEKEQAAWQEYQTNVAKIQADAAKEAERIQRDLAKNLAKEEKAMQQDIAKIRKDSQKEINRRVQDQAREERNIRRQRQIEAKADQRLFDFDMRQLAAEGEFNQIREALQRRAIEKQIAAEKQAEDDRQRQENNRVEIERMRQDEADKIAERQAQAEQRMQELRDQAAEDLAVNQERLQEELAQEAAAYEQKMADLRQWRDDKLQQIEESKQESLAKLAEELTQNKDLTQEEMEATKEIAAQLGEETGAAYAEAINDAFERNLRVREIANAGMGGGGGSGGGGSSRSGGGRRGGSSGADSGGGSSDGGTVMQNFAVGARDFIVPPGYPNDSYRVGLSSGEKVTVIPAGQGNGGGNVFNINVNGPGGRELAGIMERKAKEAVNEYHNLISQWSNQ